MIDVCDFTCGARCAALLVPSPHADGMLHEAILGLATCDAALAVDSSEPSLGLLVADPRTLLRCAGRMWLSPGDACRGSGDGGLNRARNGAPRPPIPPRDLSWVLRRPRARRRGSKLECGLSRRRCPSPPLLGGCSASNRRERRRSTRVLPADLAGLDEGRLYGHPASQPSEHPTGGSSGPLGRP